MIKERTLLGSNADVAALPTAAISAGEASELACEQRDGDAGMDNAVASDAGVGHVAGLLASDAGVGHVAGLLARQRLGEEDRPNDAASSDPNHDSSSAAQASSLLPNHSRSRHPMQLEFWNFPGGYRYQGWRVIQVHA